MYTAPGLKSLWPWAATFGLGKSVTHGVNSAFVAPGSSGPACAAGAATAATANARAIRLSIQFLLRFLISASCVGVGSGAYPTWEEGFFFPGGEGGLDSSLDRNRRRVRHDVEERLGDEGHRAKGAQPDQL